MSYKYDAFGNRVSKGATRYLLVNNQVVAEFTDNASKQYAYGAYIDEVLAEKGSSLAYYHHNRQYNTVALTDAVGSIVEQYSTDAMGRVKAFDAAGSATSPSSLATNVLFTGRVFDAETGLYYFRARYFESELGVFISRDPLGFVDGKSVYQGWFKNRFKLDHRGLSSHDSAHPMSLGDLAAILRGGRDIAKFVTNGCKTFDLDIKELISDKIKRNNNVPEELSDAMQEIIDKAIPFGMNIEIEICNKAGCCQDEPIDDISISVEGSISVDVFPFLKAAQIGSGLLEDIIDSELSVKAFISAGGKIEHLGSLCQTGEFHFCTGISVSGELDLLAGDASFESKIQGCYSTENGMYASVEWNGEASLLGIFHGETNGNLCLSGSCPAN